MQELMVLKLGNHFIVAAIMKARNNENNHP
jgi:hypothetical protein